MWGRISRRTVPAFTMLVLANLCWAGNWVAGRAMRGAFGPCALAFWRWMIAAAVLAPFAWSTTRAQLPVIRKHWKVLAALSLCFIVLFQVFMYVGLRSTTTINASVLYSAQPLVVLALAAVLDGSRATSQQVVGLLASIAGVLIIMTHGAWSNLGAFTLHPGDAWIVLAMPASALYTVLLRRKPAGLQGLPLVFVLALFGLVVLGPAYLVEMLAWIPPTTPTVGALAGVTYVGTFASIVALLFWNRGVAALGPALAGITVNLTPLFATALAIVLLGETPQGFHLVGFLVIVAGVVFASYRPSVTARIQRATHVR